MSETWLNSPCTDPLGRVFVRDGRIFRALFRESADQALGMLEHPAVRALTQEGLVARMWRSDIKVDGYGPVLEAEKAPFDVPCERFSFGALRHAVLGWLEITRRLLPAGLALTDAHYGNFMLFAANRPRWIDLGSIRPASVLPEEAPFKAFRMFWEGMLAPLLVLAAKPQHSRLARLAIADHPLQGPRVAANEPPLSAAFVLEPPPALRGATLDAALKEAESLVPAERPAATASVAPLDEKLVAGVKAALQDRGSVACIGAETYLALAQALGGKDVLVIEPDEESVRQVDHALSQGMRTRSVALYQQHCINRLFRREAARAQAVLCLDPMRALAHDSLVQSVNIAETLSGIAGKALIAVAPYEHRSATRQMLEHAFRSVTMEHFGWPYGGWDVLVCARS
jgi:hypothetical protein